VARLAVFPAPRRPLRGRRGFTYPGVLIVVALLALWSTAAAPVWQRIGQQEREQDLLFAGQQIRAAIEHYRRAPGRNGQPGELPQRLEDLLRDDRGPVPRHHLRRPYPDPVGAGPWGLLRTADGRIAGVFSPSTAAPRRRSGFPAGLAFENARSYRDWRFVATGVPAAALQATAGADGAPLLATPEAPGLPGEPEAASPDDAPVLPAAPRPSRPSDYATRSPAACGRIEAHDRLLCREQAAAVGPAAGAACQASAAQRAAVCPFPESFPLPALFLLPR
jgi:type II secretory pathway pseudopilin PulG